jgi:hypothetical protein
MQSTLRAENKPRNSSNNSRPESQAWGMSMQSLRRLQLCNNLSLDSLVIASSRDCFVCFYLFAEELEASFLTRMGLSGKYHEAQ